MEQNAAYESIGEVAVDRPQICSATAQHAAYAGLSNVVMDDVGRLTNDGGSQQLSAYSSMTQIASSAAPLVANRGSHASTVPKVTDRSKKPGNAKASLAKRSSFGGATLPEVPTSLS